ncbi:MAG: ribonuclease J [Methylophagaceae bacterium]|jgi:ribonuclease J
MIPEQQDFWFLPLGGTGEIGMNMNLYGHDGQWLMVDCGVIFDKKNDIDGEALMSDRPHIQMADPQFIVENRQKLVGLVITHAHEDHIGAVPYLWKRLKCRVYTTKFTAEILRRKLVEVGLDGQVPVTIVEGDGTIDIGVFRVQWVALTHSIPEPYGMVISTPVGKVFHTADWKLDKGPVLGKPYDKALYQSLSQQKIDAMVCDSTNANIPGWSESEASLYKGLKHHIENANGRVVITCFGSNLARLHTLAKIAKETGRHLGLLGRSMVNMMSAAKATGLWTTVETHVDSAHLGYLPASTVLLVATGSQGEARTALNRLSMNSYRDMTLEPGDTVIFSSKVIPGNELPIEQMIERLKSMEVNVINDDNSHLSIHASGHPAADELRAMYQWVKPRCAIPVHGESHHINANAAVAKTAQVGQQLLGSNGDLYYISPALGIRRYAVKTGRLGLKNNSLIKIS